MYKLVLLRHGESLWNKENVFTGWTDIELSDFGCLQAKKAGALLKEKGFIFDMAFTSVLKRATQTLEIVLKEMGLDSVVIIERSSCLNERHYGALQGINKKDVVEKFGLEQFIIWRRGYKVRPPNGESLEDVFLRVVPYFHEKIAPAVLEKKNVLIVAHGNSLRALIKMLDNISDKDIEKLEVPTGVPIIYELDKDLKPIAFSKLL
ncbi:MAG: 2,3-bisphosphoglycerate-dependent phosphoglycerate mutase [bacterium]